ncbi:putative acetyltransferase [Rhodovulum sp. ES.010]|uniref:GNAT family N-acetyltransferase n=1 Tax=Rhodovulum sp. ES.010 TaxID=1882821 RepID=UPI0009261BFA|nr:GNAT family N-acetyltransferase [Rhodovulum sp. ES.010]SIO46351.1 putative acetyltransferase [Rhodovulum sp. ES.010]
MTIRPATATDYGAIARLLTDAFGRPDEARLVEALRADGAMAREMVIVTGAEEVRAYLALVRMVEPEGWLALAPVAVAPASQGLGLGSRLIHAALEVAEAPVVVLGEPGYYARFGFSVGRAARLVSPYPLEYTGLHEPSVEGEPPVARLVYPRAFGA